MKYVCSFVGKRIGTSQSLMSQIEPIEDKPGLGALEARRIICEKFSGVTMFELRCDDVPQTTNCNQRAR
jgi:hypothetical protein